MGDFTRPEDVAAAVCFLASEEARHVTGTELIVDGGIVNCDIYHWSSNVKYLAAAVRCAANR